MNYLIREKELKELKELIEFNEHFKNLGNCLKYSITTSLVIELFYLVIAMQLKQGKELIYGLSIIIILGIPLMTLFFEKYYFELKKKEIEKSMPDVLLQAAMTPSNNAKKIIEQIIKSSNGITKREFNKAMEEINKGQSIEKALNNLRKRIKSNVVDRVINLLIKGFKTGAEIKKVFKESAEDIIKTRSILKEKNALMLIQKYTLISSAGLLVPAVLGLVVSFVLSFGLINEGNELFKVNKTLLETALTGNQIYLVLYAIITSIFLGVQEGNKSKAIIYCIILIPFSLITYNLIQFLY